MRFHLWRTKFNKEWHPSGLVYLPDPWIHAVPPPYGPPWYQCPFWRYTEVETVNGDPVDIGSLMAYTEVHELVMCCSPFFQGHGPSYMRPAWPFLESDSIAEFLWLTPNLPYGIQIPYVSGADTITEWTVARNQWRRAWRMTIVRQSFVVYPGTVLVPSVKTCTLEQISLYPKGFVMNPGYTYHASDGTTSEERQRAVDVNAYMKFFPEGNPGRPFFD